MSKPKASRDRLGLVDITMVFTRHWRVICRICGEDRSAVDYILVRHWAKAHAETHTQKGIMRGLQPSKDRRKR